MHSNHVLLEQRALGAQRDTHFQWQSFFLGLSVTFEGIQNQQGKKFMGNCSSVSKSQKARCSAPSAKLMLPPIESKLTGVTSTRSRSAWQGNGINHEGEAILCNKVVQQLWVLETYLKNECDTIRCLIELQQLQKVLQEVRFLVEESAFRSTVNVGGQAVHIPTCWLIIFNLRHAPVFQEQFETWKGFMEGFMLTQGSFVKMHSTVCFHFFASCLVNCDSPAPNSVPYLKAVFEILPEAYQRMVEAHAEQSKTPYSFQKCLEVHKVNGESLASMYQRLTSGQTAYTPAATAAGTVAPAPAPAPAAAAAAEGSGQRNRLGSGAR